MNQFIVDVTKTCRKKYPQGITLQEISRDFQSEHKSMIVAAKVDHVIKDLQTKLSQYADIEFIDMESADGAEVYLRSVEFLLIVAAHELYPQAKIIVESSLGNGLFCRVLMEEQLAEKHVKQLSAKMREIVAENRPITKKTMPKEAAAQLFLKQYNTEKVKLIESLQRERVSIYCCGEYYDYLYGAKVPNTGLLDKFALDFCYGGIILRTPRPEQPDEPAPLKAQPKLAKVLREADSWADILNCDYAPILNEHIANGNIGNLIRLSEALHEKQIVKIAGQITEDLENIRLVLIAGPSSSGKTTFAQRLAIQLQVNGIKPQTISLDDYFVNREETPRNAFGEYNFESLYALDLKLFNEQLVQLLAGNEVELPRYNFINGRREANGRKIKLQPQQPIIIEGIHGLNEQLTASIPRENKYKIYISALTQLDLDAHNRISTTQSRLIRRIVRDNQFRGSDAKKTIAQWGAVRAGEEENIFPYQEDADVMFNSALIYELGVLKKYAEPLLQRVGQEVPEYTMAHRLLDFLEYFSSIDNETDIPNNSIIREFIGGSCFFD